MISPRCVVLPVEAKQELVEPAAYLLEGIGDRVFGRARLLINHRSEQTPLPPQSPRRLQPLQNERAALTATYHRPLPASIVLQ